MTGNVIITCRQDKIAEVYFTFKNIEEIIDIYEETCEKADEQFQLVYAEAVSLNNKFGIQEKQPRLCGQQTNRNNILSEMVKQY